MPFFRDWQTAWRAALKQAKLAVRFHDLRHTCITKLVESQASEQTVMAICGHLSGRMLETTRTCAQGPRRGGYKTRGITVQEVALT